MTYKDDLPDAIYKAAVDALYQARNDGKMMDEAAACVARAVLAAAVALGDSGPVGAP